MRSLFSTLIALVALASIAAAQAPDTAWTRNFRPDYYYDAMAVTLSNEIVMVEAHANYGTWWKWNEFGSLVDSNLTIGYEPNDSGLVDTSVIGTWDIEPCIDGTGDCIVVGNSHGINEPRGSFFPFAARIGNDGNVVWRRSYVCFTEHLSYITHSVVPTPDGGAILYGQADDSRDFAIGVNAWGEQQWHRFYPVGGANIAAVPGGALLFNYGFGSDTNTVRINTQGEILWANHLEFSYALLVAPDTILCATNWGGILRTFKMNLAGDTVGLRSYPGRICYQLVDEPQGWSIVGSNNWFARFDGAGNQLWSTALPLQFTRAVRMRYADYALWSGGAFGKTTSGPRGNPTNLTIQPNWPDHGYARLSWKGAEWRFYQIYGSSSPDGPFDQWQGQTDDTSFLVTMDSDLKFYRVIGTDDPN